MFLEGMMHSRSAAGNTEDNPGTLVPESKKALRDERGYVKIQKTTGRSSHWPKRDNLNIKKNKGRRKEEGESFQNPNSTITTGGNDGVNSTNFLH